MKMLLQPFLFENSDLRYLVFFLNKQPCKSLAKLETITAESWTVQNGIVDKLQGLVGMISSAKLANTSLYCNLSCFPSIFLGALIFYEFNPLYKLKILIEYLFNIFQ